MNENNINLRVGIINKEGTEFILKIKEYLPILAEKMPYNDQYDQDISSDNIKKTMVDADIILLAGEAGAYRAGITLAENLPNNDKPSLKIGGGRRNFYHRQIRAENKTQTQERINAILNPDQHQYYNVEEDHWLQ